MKFLGLLFVHFFLILAKITDNMDGEDPVKVIDSVDNVDHSKITVRPIFPSFSITSSIQNTSPGPQEISTKLKEKIQSGGSHLLINNQFIFLFHWFVNFV